MIVRPLYRMSTEAEVLALSYPMFKESRYVRLGWDEEGARAYIHEFMLSPNAISLGLYTPQGELVGMVVGACGKFIPYVLSRVAVHHLLYIMPEYRQAGLTKTLVDAFVTRAKAGGAKEIAFNDAFGDAGSPADRFFEAYSFNGKMLKRHGSHWSLEV